MDVLDALVEIGNDSVKTVELTGWLVDLSNGLFVLGDHFPLCHDFPAKVKILNENVIYLILQQVPSLGGGKSLLFYKAKILGEFINSTAPTILARQIFVNYDVSSQDFHEVKFDDHSIACLVQSFGDYKFRSRAPMGDWVDGLDGAT